MIWTVADGSSSTIRNSRPGKRSAAFAEFGDGGILRSTGAATTLKSEERRTGPSLGTNSKTLPSSGRLSFVKWLVRLCQRSDPPRMVQDAEMESLEREMLSLSGLAGEAAMDRASSGDN